MNRAPTDDPLCTGTTSRMDDLLAKPSMKTKRVKSTKTAAPVPVTLSVILKELDEAFVNDTRKDGSTFVRLKDGCAPWVNSDLMLRVHKNLDDRLPDDWVYQHAGLIAGNLTNYAAETVDDMRDNLSEIADGLVDPYNADLTKWLASHLNNVGLCDEAVEEMGVGSAGGVIGYIQAGQFYALERIGGALLKEVEDELKRRNSL